ncbi:putative sporulation protein YtxC [Brevibacillus daliensis]|uniref:putative sporulation protein YtxC n=1 Tax=Brevibacillus daliensis TaxID=2892995 RepID=UPI001E483E8E|nr:putative sporulation protein YtxC [Brevibacillus daliensis]
MQTISVLLQKKNERSLERFRNILDNLLEQLSAEPVRVKWEEHETFAYHEFRFVSWSREEYTCDSLDFLRSFVALSLTEWTLQVVEVDVLKSFLKRREDTSLVQKFDEIYPYIQFVFHELDELRESLNRTTRRVAVFEQYYEYLDMEAAIYVEGFVTFRLKNYLMLLNKALVMGMEQYHQDKEYQEFVELLRHFVSKQEQKYPLVHVVQASKGEYMVYNEQDERINVDEWNSIFHFDRERQEDFIVSTLITLAPEKIFVHRIDSNSLMGQTLRTIFGERVISCSSCAHCLTTQESLTSFSPLTIIHK